MVLPVKSDRNPPLSLTTLLIVLTLVLIPIVSHSGQQDSGDYVTVKVKALYPNGDPASNITVIADRFWVPGTYVVAENTTNSEGLTILRIPSRLRFVYIYAKLPYYNIIVDISPNYILSRGMRVEVSAKLINLTIIINLKPSMLYLILIDEYGKTVNGVIELYYQNNLLMRTEGPIISVSYVHGIPLLSSDVLESMGYDGTYRIIIKTADGKTIVRDLRIPYNGSFIIDLHEPKIMYSRAVISLDRVLGYIDVNGSIIVNDGLNTDSLRMNMSLVYNNKSAPLNAIRSHGIGVRYVFGFKTINKRLLEELIKAYKDGTLYIVIEIIDPGNHTCFTRIKPYVRLERTGIGSEIEITPVPHCTCGIVIEKPTPEEMKHEERMDLTLFIIVLAIASLSIFLEILRRRR